MRQSSQFVQARQEKSREHARRAASLQVTCNSKKSRQAHLLHGNNFVRVTFIGELAK